MCKCGEWGFLDGWHGDFNVRNQLGDCVEYVELLAAVVYYILRHAEGAVLPWRSWALWEKGVLDLAGLILLIVLGTRNKPI